jgi:subtilisin family serine protease
MEEAVEALRQAGIVVVVSAGNYGPACGSVEYPPAIYPQSFSIGNFDHRSDQIHSRSSRGPATYDSTSQLKPNLSAPGVSILSSMGSAYYGTLTGTSMAAPHVAGAVALLLSAAPDYSGRVEAIEHLLMTSAEPVTTTETCGGDGPTDVPNHTWGWGILDAAAAIEGVTGIIEGTVTDVERAAPLKGATVAVDRVTAPQGETDATGHYSLVLAAGTYSLTVHARGYYTETITGTLVATNTVQILDVGLVPHLRFYLPLILRDR